MSEKNPNPEDVLREVYQKKRITRIKIGEPDIQIAVKQTNGLGDFLSSCHYSKVILENQFGKERVGEVIVSIVEAAQLDYFLLESVVSSDLYNFNQKIWAMAAIDTMRKASVYCFPRQYSSQQSDLKPGEELHA